jgi:hypothetical protein
LRLSGLLAPEMPVGDSIAGLFLKKMHKHTMK